DAVEGDGDVAQLDVAADGRQGVVGELGVGDLGPGVEDLAQAAPRRRAALDDVADPAEGDERPLDALEEEHEARELADRQLAADAQVEPAADRGKQRDGEGEQYLRDWEQRAVDAGQGEVAPHELVVEVLEARRLA